MFNNLFKDEYSKKIEEKDLSDATVRLIMDKVRSRVIEHNAAILNSKEYQEFKTKFQAEDPTCILYQKFVDETQALKEKVKKAFLHEKDSYFIGRILNNLEDVSTKLFQLREDETDKAKDKEYPFFDMPKNSVLRQKIQDLLIVNPNKDAKEKIKSVMEQFDSLVNTKFYYDESINF